MRTRERCPLCEAPSRRATHFITTLKGYDLVRCNNCGLVYGRELLDEDKIFSIYDEDYARHYDDPALARQMRGLAERFFGDRAPGRLLEIGCGNGHTLRGLAEMNFTVRGVEVNPAAVERCAGLDVRCEPFEKYRVPPPNARFDYVVSIHVLEHVAEPVAFAGKVAKLLKPGGEWFNYMPDIEAATRYDDDAHGANWIHFRPANPAEHVNFFSSAALERLISGAGLELTDAGAAGDDHWTWARRPE